MLLRQPQKCRPQVCEPYCLQSTTEGGICDSLRYSSCAQMDVGVAKPLGSITAGPGVSGVGTSDLHFSDESEHKRAMSKVMKMVDGSLTIRRGRGYSIFCVYMETLLEFGEDLADLWLSHTAVLQLSSLELLRFAAYSFFTSTHASSRGRRTLFGDQPLSKKLNGCLLVKLSTLPSKNSK